MTETTHRHGLALARWGRARLKQELGGPLATAPSGDWCGEKRATFVTLRWLDGDLHGCIGALVPRRTIVDDVAHNAVAAALHDPRSHAIRLEQVDELDLELSILSDLQRIPAGAEKEALDAIRPGVDGIVLIWREHSATFLPSMWPRLPDVGEFMRALKVKAGLPGNFWDDAIHLERYTADKHLSIAPKGDRS
ncbi:MAG: AmmeMemoRadiSam system protein A [Myxococcales bacterium]